MAYYGVYTISMGFHGVRKIPMKGSYNFIGVDEKFTPWIFLIRSSSEDLLRKIPEIIEKAKKIGREAGISEEQIENLIVIFDREGYSAKLFRELEGSWNKGEKRKAIFISWAKYSEKWVNEFSEEKFNKSVTINYEIQESEEIKYFDTEHNMSKYGNIRAVVIESGDGEKKRSAIYTNANKNEMEAEMIVELICKRWGEENFIKEILSKHLIDYSPGYITEQLEEQPLVDNPQKKELRKEKGGLISELHKLKLQLADEVLRETREPDKLEEIKKKQVDLKSDISVLEHKIMKLECEIEKLDEKIRFNEAYAGEEMLKFNYEKKRFLDCIKIFTYNIEKKKSEQYYQ